MPRLRLLFCLLLAFGLSALSARAITIDSFTTDTNDRFDNDGSFILSGSDLTGVGFGTGGWATLLSNNVFISANHLHPGIGTTITFHASNDPNGTAISRTVASGQRIGTSDLWIGVLDSPVSSSYASYAFVTTDIADATAFASSPLNGLTGYMIGRSPTSWPSSVHDVAVGTNVFDVWAEDVTAGGTTDDGLSALYQFPSTDTTYEALLQGGDSGAPVFIVSGSTLVLVGINWFVGTATVSMTEYDLSGFSYVGNYDVEISNFIAANAVPEPAAAGILLGLGALGWVAGRRRHRA